MSDQHLTGLTTLERLVLEALAGQIGKDGTTWASPRELCKWTGLEGYFAVPALKMLRARGLLTFSVVESTFCILLLPPVSTTPLAVRFTEKWGLN